MKLLIIEAAALGYEVWQTHKKAEFWDKLEKQSIDTVFPAVTCTVQASFRTGELPAKHGMIANGFFDRDMRKPFFWEQASTIYQGKRIWDDFRKKGNSVGQICWQQSIGNDADLILTPAPIHKHHGGMIQDFYSRPPNLYKHLCEKQGKKFNLHNYWGPFTSSASSEWITHATVELLKSGKAADLQLVYLPHLDYEMQKSGPNSKASKKEFYKLEDMLEMLFAAAKIAGYEVVIFGDYAITEAEEALFPNKILRDAGLFSVRDVKGMLYPDIYSSKAFAMVDHQVAHVYISEKADISKAKTSLELAPGIKNVFEHQAMNNKRSGELILEAQKGYWFAYPWWDHKSEAPDYANHVDIHNKPGFDPCELYLAFWPPMSVSQDTAKIKGTHGASGEKVLWASSFEFDKIDNIVTAAEFIKDKLG